jgi:hypothetical protein
LREKGRIPCRNYGWKGVYNDILIVNSRTISYELQENFSRCSECPDAVKRPTFGLKMTASEDRKQGEAWAWIGLAGMET